MSKYKVGDKVVMEITDRFKNAYGHEYYSILDSVYSTEFIDEKSEPLRNYTEPLEAKIRRQAAEITRLLRENKELKNEKQELTRERNQLMGRCGGLSAAKIKAFNNGRLAGQNEAWELVRKIFDMETNDIEDIFIKEDAWNLGTVLNNYTYQEAAAKVAEWEKAKEEIKVGDVLEDIYVSKVKCVVTNLYPDNMAYSIFGDGTAGMHELNNFKKTGRHIDIDSFLKQIGGEE